MPFFRHTITRRALPLAVAAALAGCERKEPRVYLAPKELPPKAMAHADDDGHAHAPEPERPALPKLAWTLPAGWKELAGDDLNFARFSAGEASLNITPLVSLEGKETLLITMWRDSFQLPPLDDAEALKLLQDIPIAGAIGKVFDMAGDRTEAATGAKTKMRIYTAVLHRGDRSWFFKLQGTPEAVEAQIPALKQFLTSLKFEDVAPSVTPTPAQPVATAPATPAPAMPAAPAASVPAGTPAGWTTVAPGPMQAAKFTVPEKDGAKAEVSVSIFPSDTGGAVANVRRWRGQVGLPDVDDAAIQASVKPLEGGPQGAWIVELENAGRALTGAIVPRGGNWYFYKLMGGTPAVAAAKEAFILFVRAQ